MAAMNVKGIIPAKGLYNGGRQAMPYL